MPTLNEIAIQVLKESDDNVEKALPKFNKLLLANPVMLNELSRPYLQAISPGSIKVREHKVRPHRRRTPEERQAALIGTAKVTAQQIYRMTVAGRPLGDIRFGELASLKQQHVREATNNLMLGIKQVETAILFEKITEHCTAEPDTKIRDAIKPDVLQRLVSEAQHEAPQRTELGMRRAAEVMENRNALT